MLEEVRNVIELRAKQTLRDMEPEDIEILFSGDSPKQVNHYSQQYNLESELKLNVRKHIDR